MKKVILMTLLACLMVGCKKGENKTEPKEEPKKSVAKESTWDVFLIGSWRYEEADGSQTDYPRGIESFHASGDYVCYTEDADGQKVVMNGTWKLDDEEEFVVWVTVNTIENAKETISSEPKTIKYVVNSLAPESTLVYQFDKTSRIAEWIGL